MRHIRSINTILVNVLFNERQVLLCHIAKLQVEILQMVRLATRNRSSTVVGTIDAIEGILE